MIKFLKKFVFSFNLMAIVLLLGAYASTIIDPQKFWPLAFLGLAFPILVLINIGFCLFWLILLNRRALYSLIVLLIGSHYIMQTVQFRKKNIEIADSLSLKIISYNTGLFGYYQSRWYTKQTIEKINDLKPDILCLQEFLNMGPEGKSTLDSFKRLCHFKYHTFEKLNEDRKKGVYGLVIFSKHPIINSGTVDFGQKTGNMCIYADISIDTATYRIYNIHLQSFRFKKKDYNFIENLAEDNEEKIVHSKNIISRMKEAYLKKALQAKDIKKHFRAQNLPYFLVGDFNDPPVSYAYNILAEDLKDAFVENGIGFGKTYVGAMPNFRIDYILFPERFMGIAYKTYVLQSDHRLLESVIKKQ